MYVSLRLLALATDTMDQRDGILATLREQAAALPGVQSLWVAPVLDTPVINAGHIVWRMTFQSEREAVAATLSPHWRDVIAPILQGLSVTAVGYRVTRSDVQKQGAGIWRALIFRVTPRGFPDHVVTLENQLLMFPKYMSCIQSWALSTVAQVEGPKAFTHVWEQEFDGLEGLTGEYMTHPLHWGLADSFFDAELPEYIVDPHLIQVVANIDQSIMS